MNIIVTHTLKETIPFFELFTEGEEIKLDESAIRTINEPRPDDVEKLQEYIANRVYLGFDVKEDVKFLMWVASIDPMQLFTTDLEVREDLHPIIIKSLNLVEKKLISRMGPWRCEDAAYIDNMYLLNHLRLEKYPWNYSILIYNYAIENGNLEMIKYAWKNGCWWTYSVCDCAARMGNLEILKYLHENGCKLDEKTRDYAYQYYRLGIIEYLRANKDILSFRLL